MIMRLNYINTENQHGIYFIQQINVPFALPTTLYHSAISLVVHTSNKLNIFSKRCKEKSFKSEGQ